MNKKDEMILIDVLKEISMNKNSAFTTSDIMDKIKDSNYFAKMKITDGYLRKRVNGLLAPWSNIDILSDYEGYSEKGKANERVYSTDKRFIEIIDDQEFLGQLDYEKEVVIFEEGHILTKEEEILKKNLGNKVPDPDIIGSFLKRKGKAIQNEVEILSKKKTELVKKMLEDNSTISKYQKELDKKTAERLSKNKGAYEELLNKENETKKDMNKTLIAKKKIEKEVSTRENQLLPEQEKLINRNNGRVYDNIRGLLFTIEEKKEIVNIMKDVVNKINSNQHNYSEIEKNYFLKGIKNLKESLLAEITNS